MFSGLFHIKYIFMAAFDIHLLIKKRMNPTEVRTNNCQFLHCLSNFYDIL